MSQTRIYLPLTGAHLESLATQRQIGAVPLRAYAVTEAVRRTFGAADDEELEYAALGDASEAAAAARVNGGRIVVAAADVDSGALTEQPEVADSAVDLTDVLALLRIASFHVEEDPRAPEEELLWYDVTELAEVIRLVNP